MGGMRLNGQRRRGAERRTPDATIEFMRLMWAVDHELQSVSKRMVGRLGLTAPQRLAVRFIGRQPGLTAGVLAGLLHLDPGTITGIVKRLEQAGLVSRERNAGDTRLMHLTLTVKGRAINRRRRGTVEAAVHRVLTSAGSAEIEATARLLKRLAIELGAE
jgi:DNA-binding MarR family transcriptional regulator